MKLEELVEQFALNVAAQTEAILERGRQDREQARQEVQCRGR